MDVRHTQWMQGVMRSAVVLSVALLAACGGGGDSPQQCQVPERQAWLRDYLDYAYLWRDWSPRPAPGSVDTLEAYFEASKYAGTGAPNFAVPDRWSYFSSTAAFDQFYTEGKTLGYGVFVTGIEAEEVAGTPLRVRYVEPGSPASLAATLVQRGDKLVTVNGRAASELVAAKDYSALSPQTQSDVLTLVLENTAGVQRTVRLNAATYNLVPVNLGQVLTSANNRKVGYVLVKDMVSQAEAPWDAQMAVFKAQGVQDLVLDLRYNGGGLVSTGAHLASFVNAVATGGKTYARLQHNASMAADGYNTFYSFASPTNALGLSRVYVLTGPRTCSASEQVVNGLKPFVNVVQVGDTTCGKPVGFRPRDDNCGATWSVVNFESKNANDVGGYVDGLAPGCAVAEDWTRALGAANEPLLSAALTLADGGVCPVTTAAGRAQAQSAGQPPSGRPSLHDGERPAMIPR